MLILSALGKLSQEDCSKFKTCLGCIANIRPSRKTYIINHKVETKIVKKKNHPEFHTDKWVLRLNDTPMLTQHYQTGMQLLILV